MRKVTLHKIVEVKYVLRDGGASGDVLEIMDEHWPLKFYFGAGAMIPAFEEALLGLNEGGNFAFMIPANEAYGLLNPNQIKEIPLSEIPDNEQFPNRQFEIGDRLVFAMGTQEQQLGTVSEVLEHALLIDFNHALAGKDLHFSGQVLYVREPREEEKKAQRYIEPNGIRSNSRLSDGPDF